MNSTNLIVKLGAGKSFGELALQNNEPRAASIIPTADVHFLVVTREMFKKNLLKAEKKK